MNNLAESAINLLGQQHDCDNVKEFLDSLPETPVIYELEFDLHYSLPHFGMSMLFRRGELLTIFLYREGHQNFSEYPTLPPLGISFNSTPRQVVEMLGKPNSRTTIGRFFSKKTRSLSYDLYGYSIHIEFDDDEMARLLAYQVPLGKENR